MAAGRTGIVHIGAKNQKKTISPGTTFIKARNDALKLEYYEISPFTLLAKGELKK
jgi:hypothetical protein